MTKDSVEACVGAEQSLSFLNWKTQEINVPPITGLLQGGLASWPTALRKKELSTSLRKGDGELSSENGGEGIPALTKLRGGLREVRDPNSRAEFSSSVGPSAA